MAKNMTRKGLAFGALFGLAASSLVATPATAAVSDSIVTTLTSGTSFNSVVGYSNELSLSTVLAPSNSSNAATLHYRVENPSGANLEIKVGTTNAAVAQTTTNGSSNTGEIWAIAGTSASTVDSDTASGATGMQTALTSFNVVPLGTQAGSASYDNLITIGVADADKDVTVTVYAWLDSSSNAANVQSDTELQGNSVTLTFYDQANVTATTTMVAPVTGAAYVEATTVTSPELNGQQLGADFIDVAFTAQGNANAVLAENTSSDAAISATKGGTTYSGTTKTWTSKAYLKYSDASDAWNGTDSTVTGTIDLSAATAGTVQTTASTFLTTIDGKTTGLGATNSGSFAVTIEGLDATGSSSTDVNDADVIAAAVTIVDADTFRFTPASGIQSKFTANATAQDIAVGVAKFWSVGTNATVQASAIYSATPYIGTTKLGAVGSTTNIGTTANDTKASIAVSENVAAGYNADATDNTNAGDTVEIRTGTTSVTATATIYYTDALDFNRIKKVGAGVPVTGSLASATGTFQINSAGVGVTSDVEYTDANGQVTFTVTTTTASSASNTVILNIAPQSIAAGAAEAARFTLVWDDAAYELFDLNAGVAQPSGSTDSYRSITAGGSYTYAFALVDQWGKAASDATYRLQVINAGRTVSSNTHSLSGGRASVVVADGAQGSGSTITTTVNVQKLTSGVWGTVAADSWDDTNYGAVTINVLASQTDAITLDADAGTTYNSTAADLSSAIADADVEAQDRRLSKVNAPAYTNDVRVNGIVTNSLTGAARGGAAVTITGDSSILFSNGTVESFGSITVLAGNDGKFTVQAYSNKAQKDSVLTLTTANGASKTVKVTFEPVANNAGTNLVITAASVLPGMTAVFTGKLTDDYGNPVDTCQDLSSPADGDCADSNESAALVVTYTGPGLVSSTLPAETGADGTFVVRVLMGSNDSGTATVSATYGAANRTISAADTGLDIDITTALSVVVGSAPATAGELATWTKKLDDTSLKMYAKNVIGAGKVQFLVNGKEIAWTRANDVDDVEGAALRTANGAYYLVRTVDDRYLVSGRNVLTIVVDGVTTTTRIFTMD